VLEIDGPRTIHRALRCGGLSSVGGERWVRGVLGAHRLGRCAWVLWWLALGGLFGWFLVWCFMSGGRFLARRPVVLILRSTLNAGICR